MTQRRQLVAPQPRRHIPPPVRTQINRTGRSEPIMPTNASEEASLIVNGTGIKRGMDRREILPAFRGDVTVADWAASPSGHTVRLRIHEPSPVHPFYGLIGGNRKGGGQRILLVAQHEDGRIVYDDQALVTWRGDDSINGQTVSLRLDTTFGEHPFAVIRSDCEQGKGKGEKVGLTVWIVDDDEYLLSAKVPFKEMSPVRQASLKGKDADFVQWTIDNAPMLMSQCGASALPEMPAGISAQEVSAILVRTFCGIATRKELDADTRNGFDARMKWALLLMMFDNRVTGRMRRYDIHIQNAGAPL